MQYQFKNAEKLQQDQKLKIRPNVDNKQVNTEESNIVNKIDESERPKVVNGVPPNGEKVMPYGFRRFFISGLN